VFGISFLKRNTRFVAWRSFRIMALPRTTRTQAQGRADSACAQGRAQDLSSHSKCRRADPTVASPGLPGRPRMMCVLLVGISLLCVSRPVLGVRCYHGYPTHPHAAKLEPGVVACARQNGARACQSWRGERGKSLVRWHAGESSLGRNGRRTPILVLRASVAFCRLVTSTDTPELLTDPAFWKLETGDERFASAVNCSKRLGIEYDTCSVFCRHYQM